MIEINLLPGSVKRTKRKTGIALSAGPLANIKLPKFDKFLGIAVGAWVVGIGLIAWMHLGGSGRLKAAEDAKQALTRDTAALNARIAENTAALAKQDTITQKLMVIQELDAGRYMWAHIFDEVSRALPEYTWLVSIMPAESGAGEETFRIDGRMGNAFALPKFIQQLEASPFLQNVTLKGSAPVVDNGKAVYSFQIEVSWEEPPLDMIRTEPLFSPDMQPDSAISAAISEKKTGGAAKAATPAPVKPPAKPPGKN
jgi:Tfp pilus assembly protein PilN